MRKLIIILGIPIDDLNMDQALARLEEFIRVGRASGKSHQIATVNADFVVKAMKDPELRYLLQEADMATADGMPLVWGARLLGVNLEDRVAGADMVPALAERSAQKGYTMYFLGAAPGIAARAAAVLQERYPGLEVVGVQSPPYSSVIDMDQSVLEDIKAARPDILLVAFGNPKQEKWIGMYGRELGIPVMIGIGGTLDFIAGNTKRAPEWMQRAGLEWSYRLIQEPRRLWKRYAVDLTNYGVFFLRQWWAMRRGQTPTAVLPDTDWVLVGETAVLSIKGQLTVTNYADFNAKSQEALCQASRLIVNLAQATFLDSSAIGSLVGLAKQARDAGGDVLLAAAPSTILQSLKLLRLDQFFVLVDDVESGMTVSHSQPVRIKEAAPPPPFTVSQPPAAPPAVQEPAGVLTANWAVYRTPRRLDAVTAPELADKSREWIVQSPNIILDMSDTILLASAGLAALAQINRTANEHQGELRVANCSSDVLRVIQMVRFDKVLSLYRDVEAALEQPSHA